MASKKNNTETSSETTKVKVKKTKAGAFDSAAPRRYWNDEFPRTWENPNLSVKETFDKSIEAEKKEATQEEELIKVFDRKSNRHRMITKEVYDADSKRYRIKSTINTDLV